ncbi:hypothetical protein CALCODRAFT_361381 [Calocera cornea HHB12733]|uniref:CENP-C homolog n=1 Tax=Calocera cornea HHB12733 TaxID=1353952 RepID=A0A165EL90_9BASI|nr:hypothetical protein CALCODRAFT_361381 [Calocera cornea HHB12733]
MGASGAYFEGPSAVGARSRAGRHSTVDYDEIPSPGMSRTTRRRSSAPPTNKRTPTSNRRGADVDEDDEDTNLLGSAATSRATLRTTIRPDAGSRRKTGNTLLPQGEVDDDDGGVDEIEEIADPSPSTTRRRRTRRSEAADEEVVSSDRRGKGKGKGGRAVEEDDTDHDAEPIHDDDNAPQYDDDDDGMNLNEADEEAMAEENGEVAGDEEDEEPAAQEEEREEGTPSPPPKKQGRPRKGEGVKELAMRRRAERAGKSRSYERGVSEVIDVHAEGEGHYYDEQGRRRNARVRYGPLEYWRNEKVVYGRRQSGVAVVPVIKQIIKVAPDPVRPVGGTHKRPHKRKSVDDNGDDDDAPLVKRKRSESVYHDAEEPPEKGWDKQTDPLGVVIEYVTKNEVERRIAFTESMIEPREAANARFKFQKIFGDGEFLAAGMLSIPIGETKPAKSSKDNSYVFYVIQGAVKVQIYRTSFLISVGGMFLVPRGNVYSIENVAERETILFFSQARKIPEDGSVSMHDSQGMS